MPNAKTYGQFCTVARAMEILGERWSVLIIREILMGSSRYEDIRRGVPRISKTMLSQRLASLVDAGVLEKVPRLPKGHDYALTPMGAELHPLVMAVGTWGRRWLAPEPTPEQLDPDFLLWDIRRTLPPDALDKPRGLFRFAFEDLPPDRRFHFLHFERDDITWCAVNPGFEVDLEVICSVETLARIWLGDLEPLQAKAAGLLTLRGEDSVTDRFGEWFAGGYAFAGVKSALG